MRFFRFLIAAGLTTYAAVMASCASAQSPRSALTLVNNSVFTANGVQAITGPKVNSWNKNILASVGFLGDSNTWTNINQFLGTMEINGTGYVYANGPNAPVTFTTSATSPIAANSIVGNNTGSTGGPYALTASQIQTMLPSGATATYVAAAPYNALCDGATDDSAAINAAITAAGGGGHVVFPAAKVCAAASTINVGTTNLDFDCNGATIVFTNTGILGINVTGIYNKIHDCTLNGNAKAYQGIWVTGNNNKIYNNVSFGNINHGMAQDGSSTSCFYNEFHNNTAINNGAIGISSSKCDHGLITDNTTNNNGAEGITYDTSAYGVISNNRVMGNTGGTGGIGVDGNKYVVITGNVLQNNTAGGISVNNQAGTSDHGTIANNTILASGGPSIYLHSCVSAGNPIAPCQGGPYNTIAYAITGNTSDGYAGSLTIDAGSTSSRITGNVFSAVQPIDNGSYNVFVANDTDSTGPVLVNASNGQLQHWHNALAGVFNGVSSNICFAGTSLTAGVNANAATNQWRPNSWPFQFSKLLTAAGIANETNSWFGSGSVSSSVAPNGYDNRLSITGGWTTSSGFSVVGGNYALTFGPGVLSFQTIGASGTAKVWFGTVSATSTATVILGGTVSGNTVTGGTTLGTINANDGVGGALSSQTFTYASTSNAIINIVWASGTSGMFILGEDVYLAATPQLHLYNLGAGGITTTQMASGSGSTSYISTARALGCALYTIDPGANDINASIPVSTTKANIQTLITGFASIGGDTVLITPNPFSTGAITLGAQVAQVQMISQLARNNNVPYIDMYTRFGGSWTALVANGFDTNSDVYHPSVLGYADYARAAMSIVNH